MSEQPGRRDGDSTAAEADEDLSTRIRKQTANDVGATDAFGAEPGGAVDEQPAGEAPDR